ncbi:hypothetical protein NLG97_g3252 [Lecanicillium saksenae]|uniref:Uncharacterized protein n=1 Tax=Lecanicillium saksenae TaxID=468837 RepID=A0ACC1QZZ8_9HYPO|nr:hypothetical protein NLG97_g3252 [Lecanicillium saksenae]
MAAANQVFIAVIGMKTAGIGSTLPFQMLTWSFLGAGGVGKCFLSQLQALATRRPSPKLTLCYISTSKKALFHDDYSEISIDTAIDSLAASTQSPPELSQVIEMSPTSTLSPCPAA